MLRVMNRVICATAKVIIAIPQDAGVRNRGSASVPAMADI